jgi:hypothetical protein
LPEQENAYRFHRVVFEKTFSDKILLNQKERKSTYPGSHPNILPSRHALGDAYRV